MTDADRPAGFHRAPPRPDRIRQIGRGFAFVPNRFLHDGFFASLSHAERSLYLFLVLAGDRNGVSFYPYDRICSTLHLTPDDYVRTRDSLIDKDLIAFDGTRFQVLSLPAAPTARSRHPSGRRNEPRGAATAARPSRQDIEEHPLVSLADLLQSYLQRR
jgi:hypothetical protein